MGASEPLSRKSEIGNAAVIALFSREKRLKKPFPNV